MVREEKDSSIAAVVVQFVGTWSRFINDRKKDWEEKENENKRAGKIITTERFDDKQDAKKSATTSRRFVGKACDRQPYTIIYKRYGSKKRRPGARN